MIKCSCAISVGPGKSNWRGLVPAGRELGAADTLHSEIDQNCPRKMLVLSLNKGEGTIPICLMCENFHPHDKF